MKIKFDKMHTALEMDLNLQKALSKTIALRDMEKRLNAQELAMNLKVALEKTKMQKNIKNQLNC